MKTMAKSSKSKPSMHPVFHNTNNNNNKTNGGGSNNNNNNGNTVNNTKNNKSTPLIVSNPKKTLKLNTGFDIRRIEKIRKLKRKIKSIETDKSHELIKRISRLKRARDDQIAWIKKQSKKASEITFTSYERQSDEMEKELNQRQRALREHTMRELQRIKNRIHNSKKAHYNNIHNNNTTTMSSSNSNNNNKYSKQDIESDIREIFIGYWSNDIFNTCIAPNNKRLTRNTAKNKRVSNRFNGTDLSKQRLHLNDQEIRGDLKKLLKAEEKYDDFMDDSTNYYYNESHSNDHDNAHNNDGNNNGNNNVMDYDQFMVEAGVGQYDYNRPNKIGTITERLGYLNDPQITDPFSRNQHPRRTRKPVSYSYDNDANHIMYHSQEVEFMIDEPYSQRCSQLINGNNGNNQNNQDSDTNDYKLSEKGHVVSIANFTVTHGSLVRINYLSTNTTIDAKVFSIKKNQLSAKSIVGKKKKRIWYKDLRIGKINIVPAKMY